MAAEQGLAVDEDELPAADGGAAAAGQGGRGREETGNAGHLGVRRGAAISPARSSSPGTTQVVSEATVTRRCWPAAAGRSRWPLRADEVELVLDRTPFYAEGGGQLADTGMITVADGAASRGARRAAAGARPDRAPRPGHCTARSRSATPAYAEIDVERRRAISRSHTATHLVHRAFRGALGESAAQAGSLRTRRAGCVSTSHASGAVPHVGAARRRGRGQQVLIDDLDVRAFITSIDEARRDGRDGAVRREVRRPGPGGRGRRLLARAVRRHARGQVRPARAGQDPRRVVHRLRRPPGRGARRHWTRSGSSPPRACW